MSKSIYPRLADQLGIDPLYSSKRKIEKECEKISY